MGIVHLMPTPYLCHKTKRMKRLCLNIMKWFLPVLFISYMAGITLFTHSHVVNGVTIVHSHPFKKNSPHSHTTVEFQLIQLLNHLTATDGGIVIPCFSFIAILLCTVLCFPRQMACLASVRGVISLRAPPCVRFK